MSTAVPRGRPVCSRCFIEALEFADRVEVERVISRVRWRIKADFGKR